MKFTFCEQISEIIKNSLTVEFKDLYDEKLIVDLINELNPFIIKADENLKSNFKIHQDIHYQNKTDFYKSRNTIIEQIRRILYSELVHNEGWAELHAAGISIKDKSILLVGQTKAGKSSTSFYLVHKYKGAFIGSDTIFIHPRGKYMIGFPEGFGVSTYVGDMLGLNEKTAMQSSYENYWFTNQHMRNLEYTLKPLAGIDLIIFPSFAKENIHVQTKKIENAKVKILSTANTVNIQSVENNFDYLDHIPCYEIVTYGIHHDYIKVLETLISKDEISCNIFNSF
jgi:hypothetical protein